MPVRLDVRDPDFDGQFEGLVARRRDAEADVRAVVADILATVRRDGDTALFALTERFDRCAMSAETIRFDAGEIDAALARVGPRVTHALETAADRIAAFHTLQMPQPLETLDAHGNRLASRWTPVDSVGIYVPGGRAAYPSSVLMNAVPARVAGVARIAMVVPTPDGEVDPAVLAAASIAGIDEIYRVGGAQAVAALAFGTASIDPVDKIVGPGNAYVAEAKRQVFGTVGIDMIAGPSEVLVVADSASDPAWIAIDLLSQAEHDERAQAILVTDDRAFADAVERAVADRLATLPRASLAGASWRDHGAVIVLGSLEDAPRVIDRIAPEHLELAVAEADALADQVRHAGAIFLGHHTPEAIGDYVAGPNHVLPTGRTARFASGLGVLDFLKRTSLVRCSPEGLAAIGPSARILAEAEGLDAHALSVAIRLDAAGATGDSAVPLDTVARE